MCKKIRIGKILVAKDEKGQPRVSKVEYSVWGY